MPNEDYLKEVAAARVLTTFLVVDTSKSMESNGNIDKVNSAIEEMVPLLQELSKNNADAEIRLAILAFSTGCRWVTRDSEDKPGPDSLQTFFWNRMEASGMTDMGIAFTELESKLSRKAFLKSSTGSYAPVIILLTDGNPTDDWKKGLEKLKHNNWYKLAAKIAICLDYGNTSVLNEFTGNPETVVKIDSERDDLKKILSRLVVVSSSIVSHSTDVNTKHGDEDQGNEAAKEAINEALKGSTDPDIVRPYIQTPPIDPNDVSAPAPSGWDTNDGW